MPSYSKKISLFLLAVFILTAVFFAGFAQASFWDMIRAWVTINPLEVEVSCPSEVEINKVFKVEARLFNKGEEKIKNARGEIFLPSGLTLLKKDPVQKIGIISNKKEKKVSWSVKGEKEGNYIIIASAFGELRGDSISAQDSAKVQIKESLRGAQPTNWIQNLFDFFKSGFRF